MNDCDNVRIDQFLKCLCFMFWCWLGYLLNKNWPTEELQPPSKCEKSIWGPDWLLGGSRSRMDGCLFVDFLVNLASKPISRNVEVCYLLNKNGPTEQLQATPSKWKKRMDGSWLFGQFVKPISRNVDVLQGLPIEQELTYGTIAIHSKWQKSTIWPAY